MDGDKCAEVGFDRDAAVHLCYYTTHVVIILDHIMRYLREVPYKGQVGEVEVRGAGQGAAEGVGGGEGGVSTLPQLRPEQDWVVVSDGLEEEPVADPRPGTVIDPCHT